MRREKNEGRVPTVGYRQLAREIEPRHPTELDVEHQAIKPAPVIPEKRLG